MGNTGSVAQTGKVFHLSSYE